MPIVGLIIGLTVAVVAVAWFAAVAQDRNAMDATRHTVRSVIHSNLDELGGWASDYAYWDAFVENVVRVPDPIWIDGNIGLYAHENLGIDITLVVDGTDQPYVASVAEELGSLGPVELLPEGLFGLVEAARLAAGDVDQRPEPQTAFISIDQRIFMVAGAVAKWEGEAELPVRGGGPAVLLFLREIDREMLDRFAVDYMIDGLALLSGEQPVSDGLRLAGSDGRTIGDIIWQRPSPGTAFLKTLAVPMLIVVLIAGLSLAWIVKRIRATVDQILAAHVALRNARDEADRANRAKTEFLAQMSHDLRTPLNAILGFSEVIALQSFGSDAAAAERYRDYARQIHTGGDHLRTLIDSILDVARLDAGRYELRRETVAIDAEIATCLSMLDAEINAKSLSVQAPPTGLFATADQAALEQILINLVGNAVKYTDPGGAISIAGSSCQEGTVITVSDTGRGMSPDDVEQAFELFTRGGSSFSVAGVGGNGLGLSIVKRLVDLHGGTVRLESELGVGTLVSVTLPHTAEPTDDESEPEFAQAS